LSVDGIGIKSEHLIDLGKATAETAVVELVKHAVEVGASDLFFSAGERHFTVQLRHLGIVRPLSILPAEQGRRCLAHIKARSSMDTTEKRRPLDGRWIFQVGSESNNSAEQTGRVRQSIDLRISIIPTLHGEDATIRLLPHDHSHFVIEDLGMTKGQVEQYRQIIQSPSGLVLITGPTGSGKTATLYSSLMRLNDGSRKINTIEDPIEYAVEGLHQSQVNPAIDLTFSELLRSVLRQSPDVIMIGEIRDEETAQIAVHAANSGVMVLATLHAPAAPAAIQTMRSLSARPHFLASCLRGVISQRLVRTFCADCRVSLDLSDAPHTFDEVRPWLTSDQGRALFASRGCSACGQSGYTGRTGVFEVMPVSSGLRDLIADSRSSAEIRAKAVEDGMLQFRQAALLKVACGRTSTEEVFRVIPTEHLLLED
jgi:type II secretory ATPase GspE/PulE/Tfp pilus assembly ATPase PilB-like protein